MLTDYIRVAMKSATYRKFSDGSVYGNIDLPGFEGVWSNEATWDEAEQELRRTLEDWLLLGMKLRHHLPIVDDIDLNVIVAA